MEYLEKTLKENDWFLRAEKLLKYPVKDSNEKMTGLIGIRNSIKKEGVMWNPLIVHSAKDGMFYVSVGKQRLCSLRSLDFKGLVPCRVYSKNSTSSGVLKTYPYMKVK